MLVCTLLQRHSALWRLTEKGEEQARITGEWMRANLDVRFDVHYTSEYLRAIETSGLLGLPGARWRPDVILRERGESARSWSWFDGHELPRVPLDVLLRPASCSFYFSFLMLHVAPLSPRPGSDRFLQPSATGTDWGEYDLRSQKERAEAFEDYELRRRRESLFWAPPGGESLAQVVQRVVRPREPNVTARP